MVGSSVMRSFLRGTPLVRSSKPRSIPSAGSLPMGWPADQVPFSTVPSARVKVYWTLVASAGSGSPKSSWMGDWVRSSLSLTA